MTGSEKQIKWANDIIDGCRKNIESLRDSHYINGVYVGCDFYGKIYCDKKSVTEENVMRAIEAVKAQLDAVVNKIDSAAVIIDKRQIFTFDSIAELVYKNISK